MSVRDPRAFRARANEFSDSVNVVVLRRIIVNEGASIVDVATRFNMDIAKARQFLFKKKPSEADIKFAELLYTKKKASFIAACVAAGVEEDIFKKHLRKLRQAA